MYVLICQVPENSEKCKGFHLNIKQLIFTFKKLEAENVFFLFNKWQKLSIEYWMFDDSQRFPDPRVTSSYCLFGPKPKNNQFKTILNRENQ